VSSLYFPVAVHAQQTSQRFQGVTNWSGTFTVSGQGSGTFENVSWVLNQTVTGTLNLTCLQGAACGCGGNFPSCTASGTSITTSVNDSITDSNTHATTTYVANGQYNPQFVGLSYDFVNGQYAILLDPAQPSGQVIFPDGTVQSGGILWGPRVELGYISRTALNYPYFFVPFPASGLVLNFSSPSFLSGADTFELPDLGDNTVGNWQVSWTLTPKTATPVLVIAPSGYDTWMPEAGKDETTPGNTITVTATLQDADGHPPTTKAQKIVFRLANVSHEPGIAMNFPVDAPNPGKADLQFSQDSNPGLTVSGTDQDKVETPAGSYTQSVAVVTAFDWGAWGEIQATAVMPDGSQIQGYLASDNSQTSIRLPKRSADSKIADVWKQNNGVMGKPDNDDSETSPEGRPDCIGDGFTLFEEYRGFIENGKHIQGDPNKKDFFIVNLVGADAEPGIWLFTDLTGLAVHKDIQQSEVSTAAAIFGRLGKPLVNFNHSDGAHETSQHAVLIRTCNDVSGGQTYWRSVSATIPDHGSPTATDYICLQGRDQPGTLDPGNTHRGQVGAGTISPVDALLQYDISVSHELLHSVGVLHHGETDDTASLSFLAPFTPVNPTSSPILQHNGQNIRMLDESGNDQIAALWQKVKGQILECTTVVGNPSAYSPGMVRMCTHFGGIFTNWEGSFPMFFYVGLPQGKLSGNDQCVMRYPFGELYPSTADSAVYYRVGDGTEPLGSSLCNSPAGTGINGPRSPQPRYYGARSGRGACEKWVCVSDSYPPVQDEVPEN
jgi:hypothetical protein